MKILHALVGYLAITALPFLAFSSPLAATDYDGYVDTAQYGALMEQVLGTIAETCQTITTQSHKDSALMKRVPASGDIIETRQLPVAVPVVGFILFVVADVVLTIVWIASDDPVRDRVPCRAHWLKLFYQKREAFTSGTITKIRLQYPSYNWVICHSSYSIGFDGVEGTDYGYTHHELGISFGRTIGSVILAYLQYFCFLFF